MLSCRSDQLQLNYRDKNYKDGDPIVVTASLARIGHEPFTQLILTDGQGQRFIVSDEDLLKLKHKAGQILRIKGVLRLQVLVTMREKNQVLIPMLESIEVLEVVKP